jgi:mono/diheme cytochrome c family protein
MRVLLGMVLGILVVGAGVFLYFRQGYAPVATAAPPMPFEEPVAEAALHARMVKEVRSTVLIASDESNLQAGARIYRESSAVCHGLRGQSETGIA